MDVYVEVCKEWCVVMVVIKCNCWMEVGFYVIFYFENYEMMWQQIYEMLYIEKGGEDQIVDELVVYNFFILNGLELVVIMMFEIDDLVWCKFILFWLGGVEELVVFKIGDEDVKVFVEEDVDCILVEGKVLFVYFLYFFFIFE